MTDLVHNEQPSEAVLDAVRGLLMWHTGTATAVSRSVGNLRLHLKYDDHAVTPPGFGELADTAHVTNALFGHVLYLTFQSALAREPQATQVQE